MPRRDAQTPGHRKGFFNVWLYRIVDENGIVDPEEETASRRASFALEIAASTEPTESLVNKIDVMRALDRLTPRQTRSRRASLTTGRDEQAEEDCEKCSRFPTAPVRFHVV